MYTLDTNAIIYYLHKEPQAVAAVSKVLDKNFPVFVSTITELELYSYPLLNACLTEEIESMLATVTVLPLDTRTAKYAGGLRRHYGMKLADSAIAATALLTGSILLTRNIKDFKRIPSLKLQKI